ncbi:bifunctional Helicase [Babesia duncani]|uniref:Bifunctional Helicase n=1 Tax=Babesia duncani TaxID=323732 RepID=A0AAD9PMD2_9APIC|nr:bifunctional Helicase [Babesia duncani]
MPRNSLFINYRNIQISFTNMEDDEDSNAVSKHKKSNSGDGFGAFGVLGLNRTLCFILEKKLKYNQPSAIQRRAIGAILKRKDVVCIARTGSGKTIAYLAPLVQLLESHSQTVGTRCLILLPTRELVLQVNSVLKKFINFSNQSDSLRKATLVGGQSLETQFGSLSFNPDIVIATPGRLSQHLVEKSFCMSLLQHFVIDESDKLFEMGFLPDVYKIFSNLPSNRQIILVSATLPSALNEFVAFGLSDPVVAQVDKDMHISDDLHLRFIYCRSEDKVASLLRLLRLHSGSKDERCIVFVATRHHVEYLSLLLKKCDFAVSAVHGKMDSVSRVNQLTLFQKFKTRILIVTDVGARGLDLPLIDNVINFDFPHSSKLFIHRVGRTARAGKSGIAISFVTMYDFSFCFDVVASIGRMLVLTPSGSNKNEAAIGALGNLTSDIERLQMIVNSDEELKSLKRSMEASYNLYYKVRPAASKSSIQRANDLLESMGGITAISQSIHPNYKQDAITVECNHTQVDKDAKEEILQYLHGFRPGNVKQSLATIPAESTANMENAKIYNRHFKKKGTGGPIDLDIAQPLVTSTSTDAYQDELKLPNITLNITADAEEEMQKQRYQHKQAWNPKRKRFVGVTIDKATNKVVKGKTKMEKRDLLKKWAKTTHRRIQQVGETEEQGVKGRKRGVSSMNEEEPKMNMDELGEMFPKHKAVFEAAKMNLPMSNKQKRTLKRLTKTPKHDPRTSVKPTKKSSKKTKHKRLPKIEFQKRLDKKIAKKGAANRSKVIIRRKRH